VKRARFSARGVEPTASPGTSKIWGLASLDPRHPAPVHTDLANDISFSLFTTAIGLAFFAVFATVGVAMIVCAFLIHNRE